MANKKNENLIIPAFTDKEKAEYSKLMERITNTQNKADGLAKTIAGALYTIKCKKLYLIDGYNSITEYATTVHGISKGTVSDAIKVFERFRDPDKIEIHEDYNEYAWRALIMIKGLSDDEIKELGITPEMPSPKIREILNARKAIEEKEENTESTESTEPTETSESTENTESESFEPSGITENVISLADFAGIEEFTEYMHEHWEEVARGDYEIRITK